MKDISLIHPSLLTEYEREECIDMVKHIPRRYVERNLPECKMLCIIRCRCCGCIIGLGVIKGENKGYNKALSERSGYKIPDDSLELGYVSINKRYRGQGLANVIVKELCLHYSGHLHAATESERMEKVNIKCGFQLVGNKWRFESGELGGLWIR